MPEQFSGGPLEDGRDSNADDGRWYTLGLALVQEGFERPRLIDDELRARLERVIDYMDTAE